MAYPLLRLQFSYQRNGFTNKFIVESGEGTKCIIVTYHHKGQRIENLAAQSPQMTPLFLIVKEPFVVVVSLC